MATSRDFEKLWKQYQDEVQSSGKSIVTYCQENGIVYAQFERWYKKRGSSQDRQPVLVPIEVTDLPKEFVYSQFECRHKITTGQPLPSN